MKQEIIERFHPKEVIVNYMGATMGTYAGKDGMIISFNVKPLNDLEDDSGAFSYCPSMRNVI